MVTYIDCTPDIRRQWTTRSAVAGISSALHINELISTSSSLHSLNTKNISADDDDENVLFPISTAERDVRDESIMDEMSLFFGSQRGVSTEDQLVEYTTSDGWKIKEPTPALMVSSTTAGTSSASLEQPSVAVFPTNSEWLYAEQPFQDINMEMDMLMGQDNFWIDPLMLEEEMTVEGEIVAEVDDSLNYS